jgi:hypothetical protein
MPLMPLITFSQNQLQPYYDRPLPLRRNVNLVAGTYLRGTVLGQITDTEASAVQTVTVTGTPTGGTFTLGVTPINPPNPTGTLVLPYNATVAQAQALFDGAYGAGNTKVTGTTLPGGSLIVTFTGALAAQPVAPFTKVANGLTGGASPDYAIAQTTTGLPHTGTFGPYAHSNSDGTQIAKAILMYSCTVDALGNITISGDIPITQPEAPVYLSGWFRCEELVGLPTAGNLAADFPGARLEMGDLSSGLLALPG